MIGACNSGGTRCTGGLSLGFSLSPVLWGDIIHCSFRTRTWPSPFGRRPSLLNLVWSSASEKDALLRWWQLATTTRCHQSSWCWLRCWEYKLHTLSSSSNSGNSFLWASSIQHTSKTKMTSHDRLSLIDIELGKLKALKNRQCLSYSEYKRAKAVLMEHDGNWHCGHSNAFRPSGSLWHYPKHHPSFILVWMWCTESVQGLQSMQVLELNEQWPISEALCGEAVCPDGVCTLCHTNLTVPEENLIMWPGAGCCNRSRPSLIPAFVGLVENRYKIHQLAQ